MLLKEIFRCSILLSSLLLAFICSATPAQADPGVLQPLPFNASIARTFASATSLAPIVTESGKITVSIDGLGTNAASGVIQVLKPAGATVRKAFMAAASTGGSGYAITSTDITIDGVSVTFTDSTPSGISSNNYFADVTSMVKTKIDSAPTGTIDFTIAEANSTSIDGEILAVIFDDPNKSSDNSVILFFGAQQTAGDSFNIALGKPINLSDSKLAIDLSLGISFGYQGTDQYSQIDVNKIRMTTSAGGQDDGESANGALITVGGIEDRNENPADPSALPTEPRSDDELYNLLPFVVNGDTTIIVDTLNPSHDDNIFFASLMVSSNVAIVGEGILLSPLLVSRPVGTNYIAIAAVQDDNGNPVAGRTVTFNVIEGPNAGKTATKVTNSRGRATFIYTSAQAGSDVINASFVDSQGVTKTSNTVMVNWKNPVVVENITLTPLTSSKMIGVRNVVTALITDANGKPVTGRTVTFNITTGPNAGNTADAVTDSFGNAVFKYTSLFEGTDVINASFVDNQGATKISNNVSTIWLEYYIIGRVKNPRTFTVTCTNITTGQEVSATLNGTRDWDCELLGLKLNKGNTFTVNITGTLK